MVKFVRRFAVALSVALVFAIAGCSSGDTRDGEGDDAFLSGDAGGDGGDGGGDAGLGMDDGGGAPLAGAEAPLAGGDLNTLDIDKEPNREAAGAGNAGKSMDSLETVFFGFDSSVISGSAVSSLKRNASWLRQNPRATVQIEGHCDERGTVEYNLALGERRATAARDYLVKAGIERNRMSIISLGEERALENGHDENAWSKNRRAEFVATNLP